MLQALLSNMVQWPIEGRGCGRPAGTASLHTKNLQPQIMVTQTFREVPYGPGAGMRQYVKMFALVTKYNLL